MMVGRTLKAKYAPALAHDPLAPMGAMFPPAGPTGMLLKTRLPKRKRAPSTV
jgi:hypothetical protein